MIDRLAYCGLKCQTCPIYQAAREDDQDRQAKLRAEIAGMCKELYGIQYEAEDITDCDGCRGEGGRLFPACSKCPIRSCARQKGVETCAGCGFMPVKNWKPFLRQSRKPGNG